MKKQGFGALEVIIVIAVLLVIGGLAWYALKPKAPVTSQTSPSVQVSASTTPNSSETDKWYQFTNKDNTFSIKIPNGWHLSYDTSWDYLSDLNTNTGKTPKVRQITEGIGDTAIGGVTTYASMSSFQSPANFGVSTKLDGGEYAIWMEDSKKLGTFTAGSLTGEKYYYEALRDQSINKGTKAYIYKFPKSGVMITAIYLISPGDADQTSLVEKSLKTLQ